MADVHEIADGIFRIATFIPEANITFNQFLIADEKPLLFHTGQRLLFPLTLEAVRQVIDPTRLRYISWSHLEADESGALNEFLQIAPQAEAVHSELGVIVNVNDYAIRPAKVMGWRGARSGAAQTTVHDHAPGPPLLGRHPGVRGVNRNADGERSVHPARREDLHDEWRHGGTHHGVSQAVAHVYSGQPAHRAGI